MRSVLSLQPTHICHLDMMIDVLVSSFGSRTDYTPA